MGRAPRVDIADVVYHVINRGNFHSRFFEGEGAYDDFMNVIGDSLSFVPMRILAYCLMPNHWHMMLYPRNDGDLSRFMQRVTLTHTQRYHARMETRGCGHIYQGRYKSFPVENDQYFLNVLRYVERNAKRAALVEKAEDWKWSSAYIRVHGTEIWKKLLSPWPVDEPENYLTWLNGFQPQEDVENIRDATRRSQPYGSVEWTSRIVRTT